MKINGGKMQFAGRKARRSNIRTVSPDSDLDLLLTDVLAEIRPPQCIQTAFQPEITLDFSKPWKMSDLVLLVEERKLHVHKAILAISSPVFETMMSSNFKEKNAKEIPLPGKKVEEIEELLRACDYSSKLLFVARIIFRISNG